MPLLKIAPRPGIFTDGTRYSAEGTWFDSDKIRFRKGFVEKIGGWINYTTGKIFGLLLVAVRLLRYQEAVLLLLKTPATARFRVTSLRFQVFQGP
jgi:hypothetical protein